MSAPLEGIRIIDWTIWQQGPAATAMLGDLGAEVIKIEDRVGGDPSRGIMKLMGASVGVAGRNFFFETHNRNKKSIIIDLSKEKGKQIVYELVRKSDVFVQSLRPGVAKRMRLDYQTLSEHNPKLIYANISGLGPKGPEAETPVIDPIGQARCGIMMAVGEPDMPPLMTQGAISDQMGAIVGAYSVLAALLVRERTGVSQEVSTSILGSMIALQGMNVGASLILGCQLPKYSRTKAGNPLTNHYCCGDGKWLMLGMWQGDRYWHDFCQITGIQELANDPKFANLQARSQNAEELCSILSKLFASKPRDEWLRILKQNEDFMFGPINNVNDLVNDPQVLANDYIIDYDHPAFGKIKMVGFPVEFEKTPARVERPAPEFGQHTEEVLTQILGYSREEISRLKDEEVI